MSLDQSWRHINENRDQMTVTHTNNGRDVTETGEGVTGHSPSQHLISMRSSKWNSIPQISQWTSGTWTPTQAAEAEALTAHQIGQHMHSGWTSRPARPSKIGGQSIRDRGVWTDGVRRPSLQFWWGGSSKDHACKSRRIDVPSCGLSSSLGLWNPCRIFLSASKKGTSPIMVPELSLLSNPLG